MGPSENQVYEDLGFKSQPTQHFFRRSKTGGASSQKKKKFNRFIIFWGLHPRTHAQIQKVAMKSTASYTWFWNGPYIFIFFDNCLKNIIHLKPGIIGNLTKASGFDHGPIICQHKLLSIFTYLNNKLLASIWVGEVQGQIV